jgi:nitrite reductase/ring-hydroxylating ferredoxin subunit
LVLASALLRTRRRTSRAVAASTAGFAVAMASAYLGGVLVYKREIGPNHALAGEPPEEFARTIAAAELREGEKRRVMVGDAPVVVLRHQGQICALAERCAHQGGPLSEGELHEGTITCPWHGSTFRVDDGSLVHGPSTFDQPCYETRVRDGNIKVKPRSA